MEIFNTLKACNFLSLLSFFFSLLLLPGHASSPAGTIERTTNQQVLASLPPGHETVPTYGSSQLFLASPSGRYAAFLVRVETPVSGSGSGNDFCYIRIEEAAGQSVRESECTSVSTVNTCTLVFSYAGLEIFDGTHSAWDTGADDDGDHLRRLDLLDQGGDMEIRDRDGKVVWKASDSPEKNQSCGSGPVGTPFETPIAAEQPPFGYPQPTINQPFFSGFNQPFSFNNQPFGR